MNTVLQIGEGNFLRAFAEYFIQLNKNLGDTKINVVMCQPRKNTSVINLLKKQRCQYHIIIKGKENNLIVNKSLAVNCVSRCLNTNSEYDKLTELVCRPELDAIISNTTEAGIVFDDSDILEEFPNVSFPAKITALLYERFKAGGGRIALLPVELIENNGDCLKECVKKYIDLWGLGRELNEYIDNECFFCNTLVDRIVSGKIEYGDDECAVECEPYCSWLIEANDEAKKIINFDSRVKGISYVASISPYRKRKVRILNGAHTMSVFAAYLMGFDIVRDMMCDSLMRSYLTKGIFEEVIPTIDMPKNELEKFANSVFERFENPFIDHRLIDISLNSVSKFKERCLYTMLYYKRIHGEFSDILSFSLASLIHFYTGEFKNGRYFGVRKGALYEIRDSKEVCEFFYNAAKSDDMTETVLKNEKIWGQDLTRFDGLYLKVKKYYDDIALLGMRNAVKKVTSNE